MLISADYLDQNRQLHESEPLYGVSSWKEVANVETLCRMYKTTDVLDYGCGKGRLADGLKIDIQSYDPAVPEFTKRPWPADLVICTDVLEHIEPDCLFSVLDDIRNLTRVAGYWVIATRKASKLLPDGRNTHLIIQPYEWWQRAIRQADFRIVNQLRGSKGEAVFTTILT